MPASALAQAQEIARREADARRREAELRQRQERHVEGLVGQIKQQRLELESLIAKISATSTELRGACRRNPEDTASTYLVFANSHLRLAGALSQGVRRTASMDRVLVHGLREREAAQIREAEARRQREVQAHSRLVHKLQQPSDDDFEAVFGEMVTDAK